MKKLTFFLLAGALVIIQSCTQQVSEDPSKIVTEEELALISNAGFDVNNIPPQHFEEGYLIEGDIYLTKNQLQTNFGGSSLDLPTEEHYSTNNLVSVSGSRNITVYISAADNTGNSTINKARGGNGGGGKPSGGGDSAQFPAEYGEALNDAIGRYNSENLTITFERVYSSSGADIVFTRLRKGDERQGILGSAGFPTNSGDAYGEIKMSGIIQSTYGWSTKAIATVMAHEIGHCIGFRHTDFYDRSISCGSGGNEGASTVGANYIPGTPAIGQVDFADQSFMLACTGGGDRPFNQNDKTALDYLY